MPARLTLPALAERNRQSMPERTALVVGDRAITYAEFDTLCRRTATWLAAQGVRRGDRVAVWMVNRIEWLALLFGLARLGAAVVAVNTRYRAAELEYLLERSRATMLVLQPGFRRIDFAAVLAGVDPQAARALRTVAVVDPAPDTPERILGRPATVFDAASACEPAGEDASHPEAPVALFTTSGTTRGPKLVVHPQRTLAWHSARAAQAYGFAEPGACLLAALPFCGVFGLNSALAAFAGGAPIVPMETFDADEAAGLIRAHAVTHTFGSDEMYRRLLAGVPGERPFPSARVFGFASFQPGAGEFMRAACERGVPMFGLYGSSEVQALFAMQPASLPVAQRVEGGGRPAAGADAEVRVRGIDGERLLPPGSSGEIEIRSPGVFAGYFEDPEATAAAFTADGFFRTGDVGRLRDDGTFVYETRQGDAIRLGGYLISPGEIEDTMKRIPGVADVQVVAVAIDGQSRAVAFVIPAPGAGPSEADVIAAAGALMAGFKVPARVWFVDRFPTAESANGVKIQRARLREMAIERLRA